MRRHWQHTSFCMGQCVSSCRSKRTLDSVPTTPDTENYPGLFSTSSSTTTRSISSGKSSDFFTSKEHLQQPCNQQILATSSDQPTKSPAAKFASAFSQRKISSHRINPGIPESPLHRPIPSSPSILPLRITTLLSPTPINQDGDMKGTPLKSYFRDTISSAKKSSKTVTFSETTPSPNTSAPTRKKSFFSFTKSVQKKEVETTSVPPEQALHSQSSHFPKGFLRKKSSSRSPTPVALVTKPAKEKQICRVTLSLKHSTSKKEDTEVDDSGGCSSGSKENANDDECDGQISSSYAKSPAKESRAMGNKSSSTSGNTAGVVKQFSPVVKSSSVSIIKTLSSKADINENVTSRSTLPSSKSVENPGAIYEDNLPNDKNTEAVLRDLNLIREENRLLRLKFFSEDCSKPASAVPTDVSARVHQDKMNRHHFAASRSAIPLPKSPAKPAEVANKSSGIPKLYSVGEQLEKRAHRPAAGGTSSRTRLNSSESSQQQQPSNLDSGKWVPAAEFFVPPTSTPSSSDPARPSTSPAVTRGSRRSSEPPQRSLSGSSRPARDLHKVQEPNLERRGTVGFQSRRIPIAQTVAVPKIVKAVASTASEKSTAFAVAKGGGATRIAVRKPEETKPFYTLGLYQNRPKPVDTLGKPFGVHQSGFHGVSTGIVKQRAQQYQSKVSEVSKSTGPSQVQEEQKSLTGIEESPKRPGVMRSATYTIRKHGTASSVGKGQGDLKSKSDVDPRYLTWTRKGSTKADVPSSSTGRAKQIEAFGKQPSDMSTASIDPENSYRHQVGYPLQHNASAASTSSMGTNEDGTGDHAVISDSEYLIDDEISDQPDLTLTFKDSSLKLSTSSSGESLLSCDIMIDHFDHNQDRILGELTSDSAISDISSHKPISQSSSDQISKICDVKTSPLPLEQPAKSSVLKNSPAESPSPSSARTVRNLKSPRRYVKASSSSPQNNMTTSNSKSVRHPSSDSITSRHAATTPNSKSSANSSISSLSKQRTALDSRLATVKSTHTRSILTSQSSLSSPNQQRNTRRDKIADLTIENVNKLHKQYELAECEPELKPTTDINELGPPVPLLKELLGEFQGMKNELEQLRMQLETQEKRESEKDELIKRLTGEVDWLRSVVDNKDVHVQQQNGNVIPTRTSKDSIESGSQKERYLNSLNYENAAVQTDSNNIFNRSVTYPEEEDKYGELVSFRIGRSSSVRKKL